MYYRSPGNSNPILPRSDLTLAVVVDNFDECTVINDDLDTNGYFVKNLKDPEDYQDTVTKILIQNNITSTAQISQVISHGKESTILQHFSYPA